MDDELLELNELAVPEEPQEEIVLATITEVGTDGVQIQIDGEEEAGEKEYKVNTAVKFAVGDRVKIFRNSGTYLVEYKFGAPMANYPIPAGGSDGQYLAKDGNNDYAVKWATLPTTHGIPSGGSSGQVLTKNSNNDYDVTWGNASHDLPNGGTDGQVLTKNGTTNYSVKWADAPHGLPTGGTTGQYLRKSGNTNYAVEWAGAPATDRLTSSAKHIIYNGSALYADSTSALGSSSYYWNGCYISGAIRLGANSYNSTLGFFGTTPIAKITSISTSSTLSSLIQALKNYGLL